MEERKVAVTYCEDCQLAFYDKDKCNNCGGDTEQIGSLSINAASN